MPNGGSVTRGKIRANYSFWHGEPLFREAATLPNRTKHPVWHTVSRASRPGRQGPTFPGTFCNSQFSGL